MPNYTVHNYHVDWVNSKHNAHLADRLFKKGRGGKLDKINQSHTEFMHSNVKTFPAAAKKYRALAKDIKDTVKAYRVLVVNNGAVAGALKVLDKIVSPSTGGMLHDMESDLHDMSEKNAPLI